MGNTYSGTSIEAKKKWALDDIIAAINADEWDGSVSLAKVINNNSKKMVIDYTILIGEVGFNA